MEACWAHNPEVRGSKPRSPKIADRRTFSIYAIFSAFVIVVVVTIIVSDGHSWYNILITLIAVEPAVKYSVV